MRNLEINKTSLWYANKTGETDKTDSDGFKTGEKVITYSTPTEIRITLYPSGGDVADKIFGKDASLDMVGVSNSVILEDTSLLFLSEPVVGQDLFTTYDYSVSSIKHSLNVHQYGLRRRV